MAAPQVIQDLIERFERNRDDYVAGRYNETQLRREFIDPFFKALGWDVDNEQGYAEAYKDVIHEDAIKIGSATKAPDYCFRIGGTRKFFLEAKKPSVDIKGDPGPAYQLRRYAWSAKLPLSILSDFEEFAVYDCRVRPAVGDKSTTARVMYLTYTEYAEKWDEIAARFSRDAVMKGSFDKYAESSRLKKGTSQVDDAFLAEIESWRDELAHNIALRNPKLSGRELNFAVQITIDRIIFLRICEDRGIERYGELQGLMNGQDVYARLLVLFRKADDRYNSGLFHFSQEKDRPEAPDELTPTLVIDDKILKDIFKRLYYPESPYEFSALPAEILGQVYEQFLGKVITLTAGHRARVEDKPEVKKAGGVFYTPAYIVDYIVQNTVGKLVEGKTPKEVEKIKILDPACGSGSFLLGAYQFLLDWHLRWYLENEPEHWAKGKNPPICFSELRFATENTEDTETGKKGKSKGEKGGGFKLTLGERKKILLNNLFGVDIDSQAVEVTKLSLLLKVLEGQKDLSLFARERALPDLGQNIKCGNSLIGPDFYEKGQMMMFDEEEKYKINAFDWQAVFCLRRKWTKPFNLLGCK
ncbi:MAG TPA: N-6 DNA methylase, partial [Anaerohalosphaeraceae bacterium]|nr:N-6 DNA methylase [Anaerohalosphaeraceae bacterium]